MSPRFATLFLGLFLLILSPPVLSMRILSPEAGIVYRTSVLDVNFTGNLTGEKDCYYSFGVRNYTLPDCLNRTVEFPINYGYINLTLYERNATATERETHEILIDNDFNESKGIVVFGLLALFLVLPFVFWYPCFKLDYLHTPVKLFLTLLGFFSVMVFFNLGFAVTENYLHNDAILSYFSSIILGYRWVFYSIVVYFLISFLFNVFDLIRGKVQSNKI